MVKKYGLLLSFTLKTFVSSLFWIFSFLFNITKVVFMIDWRKRERGDRRRDRCNGSSPSLNILHYFEGEKRAFTTLRTFSRLKCVYFCPVPTKTIGFPVVWAMLRAVPTLSSTVSNFVSTIPSIWRGFDPSYLFCVQVRKVEMRKRAEKRNASGQTKNNKSQSPFNLHRNLIRARTSSTSPPFYLIEKVPYLSFFLLHTHIVS